VYVVFPVSLVLWLVLCGKGVTWY